MTKKTQYKKVFDLFTELYYNMYGTKPEHSYGKCGKLIEERLINNDENTICKVMKEYFKRESPKSVFDLAVILSSYNFNKYLPIINKKRNPLLYSDEN